VRAILDTNAYSALRRGNEVVAEHVRGSEEVLLSIIVVGELFYGFRNGSRYEENVHGLQAFLEDPNVHLLPVTWNTAEIFGQISTTLRRKGRPIPTNDIWIAAQTMETGAELLSSDPHFAEVESLSWLDFSAL
jgi:tRNA(fMet)-specific endonuclease VapC